MVMIRFWNGLRGFVASRHDSEICTGKDVEKDSVKRICPSVTREEKRFLGVRGSMREWKISSPWSYDVNDPIFCDESYKFLLGQLIVSCTRSGKWTQNSSKKNTQHNENLQASSSRTQKTMNRQRTCSMNTECREGEARRI
jgi:hypothetical protein